MVNFTAACFKFTNKLNGGKKCRGVIVKISGVVGQE